VGIVGNTACLPLQTLNANQLDQESATDESVADLFTGIYMIEHAFLGGNGYGIRYAC
jgi:hypothetical protein